MIASGPDLLRLLVLPVFAWAAWRDIKTRRLPNWLWPPLVVLGLLLIAWEAFYLVPFESFTGRIFLIQVGVSLLVVAPLGYAFWWFGAFGGADAKAMIALAILLPTFPHYAVFGVSFPLVATEVGVFSLTVLTNTAILAVVVPIALGAANLIRGHTVLKVMFFARPVDLDSIPDRHGRLFETQSGISRHGIDLDALRMYLRWRNTTLAAVRADPDSHRDPDTIDDTHDPTDGGTHVGPRTDGGVVSDPDPASADETAEPVAGVDDSAAADDPAAFDDPWGAERFFESIEGSAYGSSPDQLRDALSLLSRTNSETVWVSPGLPFILPMFLGLLVAFSYGDLLFGVLGRLGFI